MISQEEPIAQLKEIRSLMERSSRFISLSGLSGIFAGVFALTGAFFANRQIEITSQIINDSMEDGTFYPSYYDSLLADLTIYLFAVAAIVLFASLTMGVILTIRKAKKNKQTIWDPISVKLLVNLMIPLIAGGIFCLVLIDHEIYGLVAPATLLFYGLALMNAGKYTLHDVWYLGLCEIVLGLIASFYIGYGITFWALGFGVLHIVYGTMMYFKYER